MISAVCHYTQSELQGSGPQSSSYVGLDICFVQDVTALAHNFEMRGAVGLEEDMKPVSLVGLAPSSKHDYCSVCSVRSP
jgi:hypothetical protein